MFIGHILKFLQAPGDLTTRSLVPKYFWIVYPNIAFLLLCWVLVQILLSLTRAPLVPPHLPGIYLTYLFFHMVINFSLPIAKSCAV